ncbi:ribosomal protein S18-alanine N-acetyltransferase [Thorsellia anophelis]|uniref:[Ribosomal protein bS18]-alanine N-acetyltransferase n=1 Tax=Thorsellia anophelis DSM 18579 TaxID=1123402 RepID=A0A1I0ED45_9GAMM|nr:ribosomal protein S18-alanine N-acetyltransferase [Thorsellia anophelis]SET43171.1 ribosomal-protein-alanine N-acetyltransferase [Thorsellia anophelis DSM 18579]
MLTIRTLSVEQIPEAFEIEIKAHSHPWTRKVFELNFAERYINLGVYDKDTLVAFCICQYVLDEASIYNIAVTPEFQNRGIGYYLLSYLIDKLVEYNISTVWLEVRESNKNAITLYGKLGFNEVNKRVGYYPKGESREDALVMALTLAM